jgi:hypothetical protein
MPGPELGPLVLTPTLLATFAIVLQAHPSDRMRWIAWIVVSLGIIGVSVAELVHPSAVAASGGNLVIMPHMHDLPRTQSIVLVMLASLGMTTVPCLFIGRIRKALNVAQRQILLQAWQFRRLGEDLLRSKP